MARLRAFRGIDTLSAVTILTETCDFRRFPTASAYMAFTGLVPSEHSSGAVIPRSLPSGGGTMGGGMMGGDCASCHGSDGRGRSTMMFAAPDITYGNLTDPRGMLEPDGGRGPTFTDATLRTAVVQGLDPEGSRLEWPMPQWQLTDQDWSGLLAYLKTLH